MLPSLVYDPRTSGPPRPRNRRPFWAPTSTGVQPRPPPTVRRHPRADNGPEAGRRSPAPGSVPCTKGSLGRPGRGRYPRLPAYLSLTYLMNRRTSTQSLYWLGIHAAAKFVATGPEGAIQFRFFDGHWGRSWEYSESFAGPAFKYIAPSCGTPWAASLPRDWAIWLLERATKAIITTARPDTSWSMTSGKT